MQTILLGVSICVEVISVYLMTRLLVRPDSNQKRALLGMLIMFVVYNFCTILQMNYRTKQSLLVYSKIEIVTVCFSSYFLLLFIVMFCHIGKAFFFMYADFILCMVIAVSSVNYEKHHLYYSVVNLRMEGRVPVLETEPGIFSMILTQQMLLSAVVVLGCAIYFYRKGRSSGVEKSELDKRKLLILALSLYLLVSVLNIVDTDQPHNLIPLVMFSICAFLLIAEERFHLLDIESFAKEQVIESMHIAVVITDRQSNFISANRMARTAFEELRYLKRGESIEFFVERTGISKEAGENPHFFYQDKYYEYKVATVILEESVQGYSITIYDNTEIYNYTRRLLQLQQEAEEKSRRTSQFLANVSHEIRTPLNAVIGLSEVELYKNPEQRTAATLKSICSAGKNMLGIVNDILDITQLDAGEMKLTQEIYNFENMLFDVSNLIEMSLEKKKIKCYIHVRKHMSRYLLGDCMKTQQILINILGNAVKYTKQGTITLDVDYERQGESIRLKMRIQDTGIGIPKEKSKEIFKLYDTVESGEHPEILSTGMGLAIARTYINMMGGEIEVESAVGKGSTFSFDLWQKVVSEEEMSVELIDHQEWNRQLEQQADAEIKNVCFPGAKVLVVDDIRNNLLVAKGFLELFQVQTDLEDDVYIALDKIRLHDYDFVLMDQKMPGLSGDEMVAEIRSWDQRESKIPIIAMSAGVLVENTEFYRSHGYDELLEKPLSLEGVYRILKTFVGERYYVTEGIEMELGVKNAGGNLERYQDILKTFYDQMEELVSVLCYPTQEQREEFIIRIHGMKGSFRNIGALRLAKLAEKLELAAREQNWDYVDVNLDIFRVDMGELLDCIRGYCSRNVRKHRMNREKATLNHEMLEELKEAAAQYDLDKCETILELLKNNEYYESDLEILTKIEREMNTLEYEHAVQTIQNFLEKSS